MFLYINDPIVFFNIFCLLCNVDNLINPEKTYTSMNQKVAFLAIDRFGDDTLAFADLHNIFFNHRGHSGHGGSFFLTPN